MDPPSNIEAHHVFPQTMRDKFKEFGINIDDPRFLTWWEKSSHSSNAKEYNKAWGAFLRDVPSPTNEQIFEKGREIMTEYGKGLNF